MSTISSTSFPAPDRPVEHSPARAVWITRPRWNPYVVGVLMGVLSWAVFAIVDKPLGVSTSVSAASGAVCELFGYDITSNAYWKKVTPRWDYGMLFLVGTMGGALVSALISRSWKVESVPPVWRQRFGATGIGSTVGRFVGAFIGGALLMYGARMADGCTSGHGISGSLQLAVSSWTFFLTMFASGLLTAYVLFGLGRPRA